MIPNNWQRTVNSNHGSQFTFLSTCFHEPIRLRSLQFPRSLSDCND
jgi:hypothetical protein